MKTYIVVIIAAIIATTGAVTFYDLIMEEWGTFKIQHNKEYTKAEDKMRMKKFIENKRIIAKHNAKYAMGLVSYKMGLNKYVDMFDDELANMMGVLNRTIIRNINGDMKDFSGAKFIEPANVEVPESIDWREKGAVTPVKDQGSCGSCWAFSATGSLEGQHFRHTGDLISLSEQNLVDCSKYGKNGCNGGNPENAFQYIKENGGIDSAQSYPYTSKYNKCRYDSSNNAANDAGFVKIPSGDEEKLKIAVATVGPISVCITTKRSFVLYEEGVYDEPNCSKRDVNHAVLIVGYGVDENDNDYWIVKNSWDVSWGDEGYIKMARNKDNQCAIASYAIYPLL